MDATKIEVSRSLSHANFLEPDSRDGAGAGEKRVLGGCCLGGWDTWKETLAQAMQGRGRSGRAPWRRHLG